MARAVLHVVKLVRCDKSRPPCANTNHIVELPLRARVVSPMCVCYIQTSHPA